jgi:bidirectional [NiFe] hydrogenase diaphorase subunit
MMAPAGTKVLTLTMDGRDVSAQQGQTIIQVGRENGIYIPYMCNVEGLSNIGACRLCVVEVEGSRRLLPACTTEVAEGMVVTTDTERLRNYRKMIVEMLFAERNHICAVCVSNGHCELQRVAQKLGVDHIRMPYLHPTLPFDASHERFVLDHDRCLLCQRCVRVCDEIEGAHTWDVRGRGVDSRVIVDLDQPWGSSESCTSCGKCVNVCPTGALAEKGRATAEMTKKRQFLPYLTIMREEDWQ